MVDVLYYKSYHLSGKRVILYLFAEIKCHNCDYSVCMN